MRRVAYALFVSMAVPALGIGAQAAPIVYSFTIAPESTLTLSANGMAPTPVALQGIVTGSLELLGATLTVTSSVLSIDDFVLPYREDLEHGVISFHFSEATGHLSGGPTPALAVSFPLEWDVAGFVLSIDARRSSRTTRATPSRSRLRSSSCWRRGSSW